MRIRLTSASTGVGVEVEAELGNIVVFGQKNNQLLVLTAGGWVPSNTCQLRDQSI